MDGTEVQLLNTACGSLAYTAGLWMAMAPYHASAFCCQGWHYNADPDAIT